MFAIKDYFFKPGEKERIEQQKKWDDLYNSICKHVYKTDQNGKNTYADQLTPLPATLSEISADLIFGEFPNFKVEQADDQVNEYLTQSGIKTKLLEAAGACSAVGTVFWHVYGGGDDVRSCFFPAENVLWEEDDGELENVKYFKLIAQDDIKLTKDYEIAEHALVEVGGEADGEEVEEYYKYIKYNYKVKVNQNNLVIALWDVEEEATDYDWLPIFKVINYGTLNSCCGKSDYQGKEQLFAEIDNRIDQINYVLEENSEPWTFVPAGVLNPLGHFNRHNGKMVEKAPGAESTVDIVSWEAGLDAAFRQIDNLIYMVFFTSRIAAPIAGLDKYGIAESGRALKYRSISTLAMINRKRQYWDKALRWFVETVGKLAEWPEFTQWDVEIGWKDGLPTDYTELVQGVIEEVRAGLKSKVTAIAQLQEIGADEAAKEYDQVMKEAGDTADTEARSGQVVI